MELKRENIGSGDSAVRKTVKAHMIRLARRDAGEEAIIELAIKFQKKADDDLHKAKLALDWVIENIEYKFDKELVEKYFPDEKKPESVEFVTAPVHLLKTKEGDCDDMSVLLAAFYIAMDLPVNFKTIAWKEIEPRKKSKDAFSHVYTEVGLFIDDEPYWIPSDPVIKEFGKEKAPVNRAEIFRV